MLARLERTSPSGGVWRYEPKLDGLRGLLWRAPSGTAQLLSRNLKDLSPAFPELVQAGRDLPLDMIRPGQAIMIAWLTTAHAPLWEPAHERAPSKQDAANYTNLLTS